MLRRSVAGAMALVVPVLWASGPAHAQADTRLTTCPSETEVRAFQFGPMAFGEISKFWSR